MSDPTVTPPALLTFVNGWYLKAKAFVYDLPWKVWRSIQWAAYHTQVWLALAAAFVAGAALSPIARPHLGSYGIPMVEAENVKPPEVKVNLSGVQASLDAIQKDQAAIAKQIAATQSVVIATQGSVAQVIDFTNHVPEMMSGMFVLGAASPPPAAAPIAKAKPQPPPKKPPAVQPEAAKTTPAVESPSSPLDIIKGWVK